MGFCFVFALKPYHQLLEAAGLVWAGGLNVSNNEIPPRTLPHLVHHRGLSNIKEQEGLQRSLELLLFVESSLRGEIPLVPPLHPLPNS